MFERIKKWYKQRLWTKDMVLNAVYKNIITTDEMYEIIGEEGEE